MGTDEYPADILGDLLDMGDGALLSDALHQGFGIQATVLQNLQQHRVDLHQASVVHDIADICKGKDGLDARAAAADHADGACGSDGGDGAVAQGGAVPVDALVKQGEAAPDGGKLLAGPVAAVVDEAHQVLRQVHALVGIIGDAQIQQQVGKAHDAQADLPGGAGDLSDLLQRVVVHIDDIVQEVDRQGDGVPQQLIVDLPSVFGPAQHFGQVDGAQVAALIGQQRLLAAGVGGLDLPLGGHHVVPVEPVQEDDARLAVGPGGVHDLVEQRPGVFPAAGLFGAGIDEVIVRAALHRLHKGLGKAHGNVEIRDVGVVFLAADELLDIGMVHPQDAHVGAPAGAALLDGLGGHVKHPHEAHRAGGHSAGGAHRGTRLAQAAEAEAGAAAGLVDEGGVFHGVEDLHHAVADGQDKAGGKLAQGPAGVHQGGGIGQKAQAGHQLEKFIGQAPDAGLLAVFPVGGGHRVSHPAEHLLHRLHRLAVFVLCQITALEYLHGIAADIGHCHRSYLLYIFKIFHAINYIL